MRRSKIKMMQRLVVAGVLMGVATGAQAQDVAKYGASWLERGVGARQMAMGGAAIALTNDVASGYWNVAGRLRSKKKWPTQAKP